MPRTRSFRFVRTIPAPPERVWEVLADHASYADWLPITTSRLEQEGDPAPNGVGAVRWLGTGPVGVREEVLAFEPNRHLAYTITDGLPVRSHRVDVHLATTDAGTQVECAGSFEPSLPGIGAAVSLGTQASIRTLLAALAKAATA